MKVRLNGVVVNGTPSRLIVVKHHLCARSMIAAHHSWDETDPEMGTLKLVLCTDFVLLNSEFIWAHSSNCACLLLNHPLQLSCTSTYFFLAFFFPFPPVFPGISESSHWIIYMLNKHVQIKNNSHVVSHFSLKCSVLNGDYLGIWSWLSSPFCAPRWQSEAHMFAQAQRRSLGGSDTCS